MGFFSKVGGKLAGVMAAVFASESKRVSHIHQSVSPVTPATASLGGRSSYTNATGINWPSIAFARSKQRRVKGTNRHRSGRTG